MRKVVPILIVIGVIAAAAIYLGPGLYRSYLLRQANQQLLAAARAGDVTAVSDFALPSQKTDVLTVFGNLVPQQYPDYIQSLKTLSYRPAGENEAWAMVTCRMEYDGNTAIYQGRLFWRYDDGQWRWDFQDSQGSAVTGLNEPEWTRLGDLMVLAQLANE